MIACIDQKKKNKKRKKNPQLFERQIYLLHYVSVPEFWVQIADGKRSTSIVLKLGQRSLAPGRSLPEEEGFA